MSDYLIPEEDGDMSSKLYFQGDCGVNKSKWLSLIKYIQPMGEGVGETITPLPEFWNDSSPGSVGELMLKLVCDYVD